MGVKQVEHRDGAESSEKKSIGGSSIVSQLPVWAIAYGTTACSCAIISKTLITYFGIKNFALVAVMQALLQMGVTFRHSGPLFEKFKRARNNRTELMECGMLCLPAMFTALSACLGFYAQGRVNVPMMLVLRRTNTIFTLVAEFLVLGRVPNNNIRVACFIIVLGSLVAGHRDLTFSPEGYMLIFLQNCATTAGTISMSFVNQRFKFESLSMMFTVAMFGFPFHASWALSSDCHMDLGLLSGALVVLLVIGGALNGLFSMNSVTKHSPLTTSVAGNVKDIAQTFVGAFAFGDYVFDFGNLFGILVSFFGCGYYAYSKLNASKAAPEKPKTA